MSTPYIGEIRMFGGNFAPLGWALCDGRELAIGENEALFTLLGTTYGGDGQVTFAVPDLRSRVPIHQGQGPGLSPRTMGEAGGAETVTLNIGQLPIHTHTAVGNSSAGNADTPVGAYWAGSSTTPQFVPGDQANTTLNPATITASGQSQSHDNMAPFQAINFIIALEGLFPSPG